ncbi:MAG TPA: hypothetical protein VI122_00660 [Thermoleophilaceae bacterium]
MPMHLDRFLPHYDIHERHSIPIDAAPATVLDEARHMTSRDVPVMVALMAIRRLPELLLRRRAPTPYTRPVLEQFERAGFVRLATEDHELVFGVVGRFWRPSGDVRRISTEGFADFAEPGWAKAAVNFRAAREGGRTILSTETRILATDAASRRRFRCYWRLIYPGSAVIRVAWLRAIKRRAERAEAQPARASSSRSTSSSVV